MVRQEDAVLVLFRMREVVPERNRCFCFSVSSCFLPSIYEPQGVLLRIV